MLDTNAVIEFLTSEEALELPDKIEEVEKLKPDLIIITKILENDGTFRQSSSSSSSSSSF